MRFASIQFWRERVAIASRQRAGVGREGGGAGRDERPLTRDVLVTFTVNTSMGFARRWYITS